MIIYTDPQSRDDHEAELAKFCLDQTSVSFFRIDAGGRFQYANRKACENLGYSLSELLDMSVFDIDPNESIENWPALWQKMSDVGSITWEATHRRKGGTTFPVEITANLLEFKTNRFAISFVRDITDRKRIEEALRLTQFVFDKASIAIFQSEIGEQILNVNEQACKSLGYSREELCKMSILDIDPAVSVEDLNEIWQKILEKGVITFETTHRRKDGTTFPVEITANLLEFEGNKYSITFVRDITSQKNDEKQKAMIEAHLRNAQRMESLGTLAGGVAHDFNNILSAINGYAELALLRCSEDPNLRRYIDRICLASERAKNLVQQILTFSRQGKSEKKPIDISRVVHETLILMRATFPSTIEIIQNIKPDLGAVFADETHIHQIAMNLFTNACHAMKNNGGRLQVDLVPFTISIHDSSNYPDMSPGEYLKLVVTDTGHGMEPDTIARIFDPYFTTKQFGEGTGLGLSTVHGIVKDHGGGIKVYSKSGVGTTFHIFLPIDEVASGHSIREPGLLPTGKECILFVDDEKFLIDIGKELLEGLGYLVETRASPFDAIEAFRVHPEKYDLIISDMNMPKMIGRKLAKEIKKIRPDIPIILCSGFSTWINANMLKEIGISKVLMKPITLNDLANTVREVLDGKIA
ncbi:MAG: PAS domain S-box protein [Desulfatirhabdiaceae bacterium]